MGSGYHVRCAIGEKRFRNKVRVTPNSGLDIEKVSCAIVGSFRAANLLALWVQRRARGMRRFFATSSPPSSSQVATKDTLQQGQPLPRHPDGLCRTAPLWFKNI